MCCIFEKQKVRESFPARGPHSKTCVLVCNRLASLSVQLVMVEPYQTQTVLISDWLNRLSPPVQSHLFLTFSNNPEERGSFSQVRVGLLILYCLRDFCTEAIPIFLYSSYIPPIFSYSSSFLWGNEEKGDVLLFGEQKDCCG